MADDLLKLAAEYKRLDKRRKFLKGKLPPNEEKHYQRLNDILANRLHGETPSDRRQELRVPTAIRIRYHSDQTFVNNYIHNLSKGGVFISTPHPLPLDSDIKIKMNFHGHHEEIEVEGKVVWENTQERAFQDVTKPGMGVKFTKIGEVAQALIDDLIHDHIEEIAKLAEEAKEEKLLVEKKKKSERSEKNKKKKKKLWGA